MTKTEKVLTALQSGETLTGKQIESRFGVGNARATVSDLRMKGFAIYANPRTNSKGETALHWASANKRGDVDVVRVLLEAGADVHATSNSGDAALS